MVHPKILLVEDEENLLLTLSERLRKEGYSVVAAESCSEAQSLFVKPGAYNLVVLDLNLPDGSGLNLIKVLRAVDSSIKILILTAFGDPESKIKGLEMGADDYVTKPFYLKELLLRIRNLCGRKDYVAKVPGDKLKIGNVVVDFDAYEMETSLMGRKKLNKKECALLKFLVAHQDRVVSRDEILNAVWDEDQYPTPRTVDNFIVRLRRWIEEDPNHPTYIQSVRGVGYRFVESPGQMSNQS